MVLNWLDRYRDTGLLILRLGFGLLIALNHGLGKIIGGPELWAQIGQTMGLFGLGFASTFWGFMSAIAEFAGGLLLAAGLLTRPALILLILNLSVAVSMHVLTGNGSPMKAIYFLIVFLALIFTGPGKYACDYFFSKNYKRRGY